LELESKNFKMRQDNKNTPINNMSQLQNYKFDWELTLHKPQS